MTVEQRPCTVRRVVGSREARSSEGTPRTVASLRFRPLLRVLAVVLVLSGGSVPTAVGGTSASSATLRIGVAPFEGDSAGVDVAQRLSVRFARLGLERLLAPGSFEAEPIFDPRAGQVRAWARGSALDAVVVGRVERDAQDDLRAVEAVVRSGHSGAALFRHSVHVARHAELDGALDRLAEAIVEGLAAQPGGGSPPPARPPLPPVSAHGVDGEAAVPAASTAVATKGSTESTTGPERPAASEPKPAAPEASDGARKPEEGAGAGGGVRASGGLETRLGVAKFRSDAPIEIQADAAELTAVGDDRKLIFQGGVRVQQDNVTLRSERLEAEYVDGASEPSRLLAEGAVHVQQNDRAARCDRAEYLRSTQQITCRGHAELLQGCDVVRGELIVLDLAGDRARVEGAASIVINPKPQEGGACVAPGRRP